MTAAREREFRPYTFFKMTTSTCPECLALVQTRVVFEDDKVYFLKHCPEHGHSRALVSEDAAYYQNAFAFSKQGGCLDHWKPVARVASPDQIG